MKILIDIPKEFEVDYNTDRFAEFFHRCLADMCTCCGNYELETAEMMEKAFAKSRLYDPDQVAEQIKKEFLMQKPGEGFILVNVWNDALNKAIEIVKGGSVDA